MIGASQKTDGELLGEFVATHADAAFAEVVQRHGPMVQAICQRVLEDHHEAQDAAQAVFRRWRGKQPRCGRIRPSAAGCASCGGLPGSQHSLGPIESATAGG